MTIGTAEKKVIYDLSLIYERGEAGSIADWLMEYITQQKKNDRNFNQNILLTITQEKCWINAMERLQKNEPIQYVLNESWFYGFKFFVDKNVLIPRPETEELVELVLRHAAFLPHKITVLDIGSGSGCIPICMKKKLPNAEVYSCDISDGALLIARKNAAAIDANIQFVQLDFLNKSNWTSLPPVDIIVSNPPYIPEKMKPTMHSNVLDYEPHEALFVPDTDPFIFYKAIALFAKDKLSTNGFVFVELHDGVSNEVKEIFGSLHFSVEIHKDIQGKERMLKAIRYRSFLNLAALWLLL